MLSVGDLCHTVAVKARLADIKIRDSMCLQGKITDVPAGCLVDK